MARMERLLRQEGVKRVIVKKSFPYPDRWKGWEWVDILPFYRSIADLLVLEHISCKGIQHNKSVVRLSASRLCPELRGAAERIAPLVRGISIDVPGEGARYAAWLHRQFGLPVRTAGEADVTVKFGPTDWTGGDVISLYEDALDLGGLCVSAQTSLLLEDDDPALLAALWECGSLDRKTLCVEGRKTLDKSL